jgi:putative transposase
MAKVIAYTFQAPAHMTCSPEPEPVIMSVPEKEDWMRKSRFTDEQIVSILRQGDAGAPIAELCRKHEITSTTYYRWERKYGGMEVSEAKRLRKIEEDNRRLKRLVADQAVNIQVLNELLGKEW